jgi:predicted anti-sigma-YlaC factor YlaD
MARADHHHVVCREFVELATDYLEGTLAADDRNVVEEHLVMCEWCEDYLDQLEHTVRAAGSADDEPVPAESQAAALEMFRQWKATR